MYDDLIGWKRQTEQTIQDTMSPKLRKQIEQIIANQASNCQRDIEVIKECMSCEEGSKKAIMKLILATKKMEMDISLYYPKEYKEYLQIRKKIIKEKRNRQTGVKEEGR